MTIDYKEALSFVKQRIDDLLKNQSSIIVGIDGMAAAGKTTFANSLKSHYKTSIIHLDDFFLQDFQKTKIRLKEIDGFIDYERFLIEVIQPLKKNISFTYHPYNCQTKTKSSKFVNNDFEVYIIEGAYALRESFDDIYDLKLLMLIDDKKQLTRIRERNHLGLVKRFKQEWIPRENKYIKYNNLDESVDLIIMS